MGVALCNGEVFFQGLRFFFLGKEEGYQAFLAYTIIFMVSYPLTDMQPSGSLPILSTPSLESPATVSTYYGNNTSQVSSAVSVTLSGIPQASCRNIHIKYIITHTHLSL